MDEKTLEKHVLDICSVSKFFNPTKFFPPDLPKEVLEEYLFYSHQRLDLLINKFSDIGYYANEQNFDYQGFKARNVIFRKGRKKKEEIWFVAHHDYCAALGAEDDATALSVMLEVASKFKDSDKNLVFGSFDLEEKGLIGSKHYAKNMPKEDMKKIKWLIDLECLGAGKNITICQKMICKKDNGKSIWKVKCDKKLVNKLFETALDLGYRFIPDDYVYFTADHTPFARRGVRTTEICSINHDLYRKLGGSKIRRNRNANPPYFYRKNWLGIKKEKIADELMGRLSIVHSKRDIPENLNFENLVKVYNTLVKFIEQE